MTLTSLPGDVVCQPYSSGDNSSLDVQVPRPLCPSVGNLRAHASGQVTIGIGFGVLLIMQLMGTRQVTLFSWTTVHSLGFKRSEKHIDRYQCDKLVTSGKSK